MNAEHNMTQLPSMFMVNGNMRPLVGTLTLVDLVEQLGFTGKRIAVELNGDVVPKSQYPVTEVRAEDRFEIVVAVGGG